MKLNPGIFKTKSSKQNKYNSLSTADASRKNQSQ